MQFGRHLGVVGCGCGAFISRWSGTMVKVMYRDRTCRTSDRGAAHMCRHVFKCPGTSRARTNAKGINWLLAGTWCPRRWECGVISENLPLNFGLITLCRERVRTDQIEIREMLEDNIPFLILFERASFPFDSFPFWQRSFFPPYRLNAGSSVSTPFFFFFI